MRDDYKEREQRRRERLEDRADKAQGESDRRLGVADSIASVIPPGQPILVGHHSERRHRRDLERIHDNMRKGIDAGDRAEHLRSRAAAVGSAGISSDDPDAPDKLREKIERAEAAQQHMKEANKIAKNKRLSDDEKIARLVAEHLVKSEAAARELLAPDFMGRVGFADYALSNNNANIRRMKARLAELERRHAAQAEALEEGEGERVTHEGRGFRVIENFELNRIQIEFDEKPAREVTYKMRHSFGFVFARSEGRSGRWQRQLNAAGRNQAKWAAEQLDAYFAATSGPVVVSHVSPDASPETRAALGELAEAAVAHFDELTSGRPRDAMPLPADGIADGGEPYTDEEMAQMGESPWPPEESERVGGRWYHVPRFASPLDTLKPHAFNREPHCDWCEDCYRPPDHPIHAARATVNLPPEPRETLFVEVTTDANAPGREFGDREFGEDDEAAQPVGFKKGERVLYVPLHAHGDLTHADCERGVVSSVAGATVFVKYDRRGHRMVTGDEDITAQGTDADQLVHLYECPMCGAEDAFVIRADDPAVGDCLVERVAWRVTEGPAAMIHRLAKERGEPISIAQAVETFERFKRMDVKGRLERVSVLRIKLAANPGSTVEQQRARDEIAVLEYMTR